MEKHALSNTRNYPAVVSFTEGDPMDEDVRDASSPAPSCRRLTALKDKLVSASTRSTAAAQLSILDCGGMVLRADITRINGTHWNLSGYWSGDVSSVSNTSQPTLAGLNQPHLSHEPQLSEPGLALGCGGWTAVPAVGQQSRHHRWRIFRQALFSNE